MFDNIYILLAKQKLTLQYANKKIALYTILSNNIVFINLNHTK